MLFFPCFGSGCFDQLLEACPTIDCDGWGNGLGGAPSPERGDVASKSMAVEFLLDAFCARNLFSYSVVIALEPDCSNDVHYDLYVRYSMNRRGVRKSYQGLP